MTRCCTNRHQIRWHELWVIVPSLRDVYLKLGYINGDLPQPSEIDPIFRKWRAENAVVKGWLINSVDPKLIGNYIIQQQKQYGMQLLQHILTALRLNKSMISRGRWQDSNKAEDQSNHITTLFKAFGERLIFGVQIPWVFKLISRNSMIQDDRVYTFLDGLDDRVFELTCSNYNLSQQNRPTAMSVGKI